MDSKASSENSTSSNGEVHTRYFKTSIVWPNLLGFAVMHAIGVFGGLYCLLGIQFLTILWTYILVFCSGMGITVGAHRLFTHRSFKATPSLKILLIILQTISGQNCLYIWVRDHRQHHMYSDTDADPHNSGRGFFFSHIGWLMMRKHPDVLRMGKHVDLSDLEADPFVMFQKKYYKTLYTVFAIAIPIAIPILLWRETFLNAVIVCYFSRYVIQLNVTWSVNSWAHFFGTRPYNKDIQPVETQFVSFVTMGEGWHNYHHSFPWDYRTSEFGSVVNVSTAVIELAARWGFAYDLKTAQPDIIRKRVESRGDESHPMWGKDAICTEIDQSDELFIKEQGSYIPVSLSGNDNPNLEREDETHLRRKILSRSG